MNHSTVNELLTAWDKGETIWSVELGGLGPGYEQAIQIAAIEFARAAKDMTRTDDKKADIEKFSGLCNDALKPIDEKLGGLSGAQFGQARWLAWQWCFEGGPAQLQERAKEQAATTIQVSKSWPQA